MKDSITIIVVALAALSIGVAIAWLGRPQPPAVGGEGAAIGDPHPGFSLSGLDGGLIDSEDFEGQVLLVNFWATWCAPCVREMPLLQDTAQRHAQDGLAVVGIAIDEPEAVRGFADNLGIAYPIAVGAADAMDVQRRWGNASGALPYTVLVDETGIIRWQRLGEVTPDQLAEVLEKWL